MEWADLIKQFFIAAAAFGGGIAAVFGYLRARRLETDKTPVAAGVAAGLIAQDTAEREITEQARQTEQLKRLNDIISEYVRESREVTAHLERMSGAWSKMADNLALLVDRYPRGK